MLRLVTLTLLALALSAAPALAFPFAPGHDDFADALPLGTGTTATHAATTAGATKEVGEPYHWGRDGSVWYRWTPAKSGGTKVDVCSGDAVVGVYTGSAVDDLEVLTHAACLRSFVAKAGTTYRIAVVADDDPAGVAFTLKLDQKTTTPDLKLAGKLVETARVGSVPLAEITGASGLQFEECTIDGHSDQRVSCWPTPGALRLDWQMLSHGQHTLEVAVRDGYGNVDPTPLVHTWTVDALPPDTAITTTSVSPVSDVAQAAFTSTEPGSTFACAVEGAAFKPCTTPFTFPFVGPGLGLEVRATDKFGNTDVTPAQWQWLRTPPPPAPKPAPAPAPKPAPAPAPAPKPAAPVPSPAGVTPRPGTSAPVPSGTGTTPVGTTRTRPACRLAVLTPTRTTRATLRRRGLTVTVREALGCRIETSVRQGTRTLARRTGHASRRAVVLRPSRRALAALRPGTRLTVRVRTLGPFASDTETVRVRVVR